MKNKQFVYVFVADNLVGAVVIAPDKKTALAKIKTENMTLAEFKDYIGREFTCFRTSIEKAVEGRSIYPCKI